jgi:hypothetical protein
MISDAIRLGIVCLIPPLSVNGGIVHSYICLYCRCMKHDEMGDFIVEFGDYETYKNARIRKGCYESRCRKNGFKEVVLPLDSNSETFHRDLTKYIIGYVQDRGKRLYSLTSYNCKVFAEELYRDLISFIQK